MHYPTQLTRAVLVLVLLALAGTTLPPPAQAQGLPWQDKGTPFGVVAALGNRVRADEIPAAVALMREAGVQWQREEIFWDRVQQHPGGPYDWDGDDAGRYNYDLAIGAQAAAGIQILGLLDYNPAWFKGKNPRPEEWIADWGDYVYSAVARYGRDRGQITYWELWNEPNLAASGYESGLYTVADFVRILEVGRAAALAADPNAKIVMGGLAPIWSEAPTPRHYDYFDYLDQVGRLGGWRFVDVIAIHPYRPNTPEGDTWRRDQSLTFSQELSRLDAVLRAYGPRPIWLTELGWSTSQSYLGVDEDTQAFLLVRSYLLAMAHPSVEKIFWYDFRDDTPPGTPYERPTTSPGEIESRYGLLRRAYPLDPARGDLRKPSFLAYRTMTEMLGGLSLQGVTLDGSDGVFWHRYAGGGRRVDVLWRTGESAPMITVACGCREALVRAWNGEVRYLLASAGGQIVIHPDQLGAPLYIEYDPPARPGRAFPATGHSIGGDIRAFWESRGGLARFGYPLTEEIVEPEPGSGRPRVVQYFERARFEHFPELSGTPYVIQLSRLGEAALQRQGFDWRSLPYQTEAPPECRIFPETGRRLCPPFLAAWEQAGGIDLVGLPLTEAAPVADEASGERYAAQYFERARIEHHPVQAGTPYEIQLGLLGREQIARWGGMP
ncbi:hypothetical protein K2Z83_04825 [Oscillochloris sp. ZM17-4]|uniref:hypothetical protein n=1 Tax=Oscillochloris sp. ZM17-4 TaxID=2866714 RepID=UPI001C73CE6B|nr:hypothetical protein [Oscillochloris sp. ZM17-4]MBX0327005.1 hypothetical protein [Oscillochloris sp. ZM17-4]